MVLTAAARVWRAEDGTERYQPCLRGDGLTDSLWRKDSPMIPCWSALTVGPPVLYPSSRAALQHAEAELRKRRAELRQTGEYIYDIYD